MGATVTIKNNFPIAIDLLKIGKEQGLEKMAAVLELKIAEQVRSGATPPPNAPATIEKKGSSKTLVDTGEMLGQITHEKDGDAYKVGVIGNRAEIAAIHEFGAPAAGIPERSFIRNQLDNSVIRGDMNEEIIKKLRDAIKKAEVK